VGLERAGGVNRRVPAHQPPRDLGSTARAAADLSPSSWRGLRRPASVVHVLPLASAASQSPGVPEARSAHRPLVYGLSTSGTPRKPRTPHHSASLYSSLVGADADRAREHLVSRGYQANFAQDGRVSVLDSRTGELLDSLRPITSNWWARDFTTERGPDGSLDDSLDREFRNSERVALNQIRDIRPPVATKSQRRALDRIAAIHLVRSHSFVSRHGEVVENWLPRAVNEVASDPRLGAIYQDLIGRNPVAGELHSLVRAYVRSAQERGDFASPGAMRRMAARIAEVLRRYHVQLVSAYAGQVPGFILPDCPVAHARPGDGRYGFAGGLAVGAADLIIVPVERRLVVFYTAHPLAHVALRTKRAIRTINAVLCRNARAEVACHPDDAAETARLIRNIGARRLG